LTGLDFLVIGAQRSGTTSLWHALASHPELHLPPSKEAPFFSHDEQFERGLDWYLEEFFSDADPRRLWGTASPHYMMGGPRAAVPEVARRIRATAPDVKLIAVLREPIARAQSHHRMVVHRGREPRSFEEAAHALLTPQALQAARQRPLEVQPYIVQGEYGRILGAYLDVFPREQLHVLLTADLEAKPIATLREIFSFLGVEDSHEPPQPEARHHRGGRGRRLDAAAERQLKEHLAHTVWPDTPYPAQHRRAFDFWFLQWNVVPDEQLPPIDPELRAALHEHFAPDSRKLTRLTGLEVPWSGPTSTAATTAQTAAPT
jgi:Sulfotransferase domain